MTLVNPATKGQAQRLLDHLVSNATAETAEIRRRLDIGNVSSAAFRLNAQLAMAGDPRRVVCRQHGRRSIWRLSESAASAA